MFPLKGGELMAVWVNICYLRHEPAAHSASPVPDKVKAEEHDHNWVALASDRSEFDSWLSHFVGVD